MAYVGLIPGVEVTSSADCKGFTLKDISTWGTGDQQRTTSVTVKLTNITDATKSVLYNDFEMVIPDDYNDFLGEGLYIPHESLSIGEKACGELMVDGAFVVEVIYNDGTYDSGEEPRAWLNFVKFEMNRAIARKNLAMITTYPMSSFGYNNDIRILILHSTFLQSAEIAHSAGMTNQLYTILDSINKLYADIEFIKKRRNE